MFEINHSDERLSSWQEGLDVKLNTKEDVATVLDMYERCLQVRNSDDIAGIAGRDGYFVCVVNTEEANSFDLFDFINNQFSAVLGTKLKVNCANARYLFPKSLSRGEYMEKESLTDDFDSSDETDTDFWDEDDDDGGIHYVLHVATGQKIPVEDAQGILIGRSTTRCDYAVDNGLMTRVHARVYLENGRYMVEDLDSKNGTFIDNLRVFKGRDREIRSGQVLRLANEEFNFV